MAILGTVAGVLGGLSGNDAGGFANSPDTLTTGDTDISFDFSGVGSVGNNGFFDDDDSVTLRSGGISTGMIVFGIVGTILGVYLLNKKKG